MANNSSGKRSRLADRLNKIRSNKFNRKKKTNGYEDIEIASKNIAKVLAVIPMVVIDNVFDKNNNKNVNLDFDRVSHNYDKRKKNAQIINQIDVSLIKKKQGMFLNKTLFYKNIKNKETKNTFIQNNADNYNNENLKERDVKKLEKKIIDLIKKDLIKIVNELEILESELYILSEINNDEKELQECRENLNEVKKILAKIDMLKEKYDYLKDNYDFEYLMEIDNRELVDNIIELKNCFEKNEVKATVSDYKLLEVYKYLYLEIDKIHEKTEKISEEKKKKEDLLKDRDIDFSKLKNNVYSIDRVKESYNNFVKNQNELLSDLDGKISKINSYEVINYRLKGFSSYLFNSFKYLNLLMLSPLKGVIPAIATQALITKNVLTNLRDNLKWEETRKFNYEAIDYTNEIYDAISDLDSTDRMLDSTLEDIVHLKAEYNNKFRQYHGDFLEYREVINKINDMENTLIGNKIKIGIMKNRMRDYERENKNKMHLVRKLNEEAEERKV